MEDERIIVKDDKGGRGVRKDRVGGQIHTGDGSSAPENLFTRSEKTP